MANDILSVLDGNDGDFKPIGLTRIDASSYGINTVAQAPLSSYDAFGRMRVASPVINFASNSAYGLEPLVWETRVSGVGNTALWDANKRAVILTLSGTGYVVRQTYSYIVYQPGRSQFLTLTGVIGSSVPGANKRVGQFDAKNGLFFQQGSDGTFSVVRRSSTSGSTANFPVPQSEWNLDRLDGTGSSGKVLDVSKDNICIIDYGWLGTATVRFGLYIDGEIIYVHAMQHANILTTSYMQTATLPFRYEIEGTPSSVARLEQICCAASSEGGYIEIPSYKFSTTREIANAISTATEVPLLAIRPKTTFGTIPNRIQVKVQSTNVLAIANPVRWSLRYYPPGTADPVTGGSYVSVNDESAVEANVAGTAVTISGGYVLQQGFSAAAGTGGQGRSVSASNVVQTAVFTLSMTADASNPLTNNDNGKPAYIVLTGLGASASAAASIEWEEIR